MQPGAITLYDSIQGSNLGHGEKSALRRWFESNAPAVLSRPRAVHVRNGMAAFRQGSESVIAGALLGLVHADAPTGLDVWGVPVDGGLGFLLTLGSAADSEYSSDARNIGTTCLGVFSFRTTTALRTEMRVKKGLAVPKHLNYGSKGVAKIAGDDMGAEDPILRAAKIALKE